MKKRKNIIDLTQNTHFGDWETALKIVMVGALHKEESNSRVTLHKEQANQIYMLKFHSLNPLYQQE